MYGIQTCKKLKVSYLRREKTKRITKGALNAWRLKIEYEVACFGRCLGEKLLQNNQSLLQQTADNASLTLRAFSYNRFVYVELKCPHHLLHQKKLKKRTVQQE